MTISREPRVARLVARYMTLPDVLEIWKRMIGTGLIGGKSVGMLLARAILKQTGPHWLERLEAHDSFFVGSDVFYSFLVENDCWWLRQKQRDPNNYLDNVDEARRRILTGRFPEYLVKEFAEMVDYYGQSPIIVRSSSLLEDNYGNAFAGKYESVFCAEPGPARQTIAGFSLGREAGLRQLDERKGAALSRPARAFGPRRADVAVGPAGVGRLPRQPVFPAGRRRGPLAQPLRLERADRSGGGHGAAGVWAGHPRGGPLGRRLHADRGPQRAGTAAGERFRRGPRVLPAKGGRDRPGGQSAGVLRFPRRGRRQPGLAADDFRLQRRPPLATRSARRTRRARQAWCSTFDELLSQTPFVADMREMLGVLQEAYDYPVDCEFTANFLDPEHYKINLVQCRPLQVTSEGDAVELPQDVCRDDCILEAHGAVIGRSRASVIDRLIYVHRRSTANCPCATATRSPA